MRQERVLTLAEELARKGDVAALRLLVRAAALPLMAEGMLDWADEKGRDLPRLLHLAIPRQVIEALRVRKVWVKEGPPKGLTLDLATDTVIFPVLPRFVLPRFPGLAFLGKTGGLSPLPPTIWGRGPKEEEACATGRAPS
jgi:hypothetical protein